MKEEIKKFLEFQGEEIYFTFSNGQWLIALKPICDALNVDWEAQRKRIKEDKILGPAQSVQTVQVGNDQGRKYVCLPEFFVYGWLFQIRSDSEKLWEYKWEIYRLIHECFKGIITKREKVLQDKSSLLVESEQLLERLVDNKDYTRLQEIQKQLKRYPSALKKLDEELLSKQRSMFD